MAGHCHELQFPRTRFANIFARVQGSDLTHCSGHSTLHRDLSHPCFFRGALFLNLHLVLRRNAKGTKKNACVPEV